VTSYRQTYSPKVSWPSLRVGGHTEPESALTERTVNFCNGYATIRKVKAFPNSIPSVGPGTDPSVQAVSPQVTVSHPPGSRLPLLSARPAVTSQPQSITALWSVPSYTAC